METSENTGNRQVLRAGDGAAKDARRSPSTPADNTSDTSGAPRLYHTLTACTRCRSRKTRCDAGLPKCGPCERTGAHCEFFDSTKQKTIPRSYVVHLQHRVRQLEEEIARREAAVLEEDSSLNSEELVRGIGAVKFGDDDEHYKEPRYVGPASGVTVTRLVLESAKKDLDPEEFQAMTIQHRHNFKNAMRTEPSPPPEFGANKFIPEARFPPEDFGMILVSLFCKKSLYMLPVLHEPTFLEEVRDVYRGSTDPFKTFKLKMVLAISLQKHSAAYSSWADSFFLSGLQDLDRIMEPMDHNTLQCLLIMVQYALVKPTRMAAYHIVGICVRLCIQLGYHQERTIMLSETPLDPITKDMRRRLFWTLASMEYGLSQVLGRPSAFATSDAHIDVAFYEPVDDRCITAGGILPGPYSTKKLISMHFFKMRRLQAEIRHTLYQNPRETPKNDEDPWFVQMLEKCNEWRASCPQDDEGSGLSKGWFNHRYNNILIFMYRPSPQVPQPSVKATHTCYSLCVENVMVQADMVKNRSADLTWVFMHQIYTVTLTLIWTIYSPTIRARYPREEVEAHIQSQIKLLNNLNERWPGADAAADLFARLAKAAMKNYDLDDRKLRESQSRSPEAPPSIYGLNTSALSDASGHSPRSIPDQLTGMHPSTNFSPTSANPQVGFSPNPAVHTPSDTGSVHTGPFSPSSPDIQHLLADPSLLQSMFFNPPAADTTASSFLESWEPIPSSSPAAGPYAGMVGAVLESQPLETPVVPEVLDPRHQHDELVNILQMEQQGYMGRGYAGVAGAAQRLQDGREWRFEATEFY